MPWVPRSSSKALVFKWFSSRVALIYSSAFRRERATLTTQFLNTRFYHLSSAVTIHLRSCISESSSDKHPMSSKIRGWSFPQQCAHLLHVEERLSKAHLRARSTKVFVPCSEEHSICTHSLFVLNEWPPMLGYQWTALRRNRPQPIARW